MQSTYTKEDYITAEKAVEAALSIGITMFDHADIYKRGNSETVFGQILKNRPDLRDQIILAIQMWDSLSRRCRIHTVLILAKVTS